MRRWLLAILLCLMPSSVYATTGVQWLYGGEDGSLPAFFGFTGDYWLAVGGSPAMETTIVRSGAYSLKFQQAADFVTTIAVAQGTSVWMGFAFYVTANPASNTNIMCWQNATNCGIDLNLKTDGTLFFSYTNLTPIATGTHPVTLSAWNYIEFKAVRDAAVGGLEVKLNGVTEFTSFATNTTSITGSRMSFGSGLNSYTTYFDDLMIRDDDYPGQVRIIARQGIAGTPTYNAWTKNSCATIDLCWSQTPFDASKNASYTTQVDQTMLIAPFSTIQSGHGTQIIASHDSVVAVLMWSERKISAGSSGGYRHRLRWGGVDTDSANTPDSTSDRPSWSIIQSASAPSAPQLDALEGGVTIATASIGGTGTTEDLWVQVAYLPGIGPRHRVRQ